MSLSHRLILLLALVAAVCFQPASAIAEPAQWKFIDITLQTTEQQPLLLVGGELPETTPLPYQAELAVPAGMQLQWIGEILGGDPSQDPDVQYTKTSANGMDLYRFTLTRSRSAQVELLAPAATTFDGTNYATSLSLSAWQDIPELRVSQRLAQGTTIVAADSAASLVAGDVGSVYYSKTLRDVKAGESVGLSFSYAPPVPGATAKGSAGSDSAVLVTIVLASLAIFGVLAFFAKRMIGRETAAVEPPRTTGTRPAAATAATAEAAAEPSEAPSAGRRKKTLVWALLGAGVLLIAGVFVVGNESASVAIADGRMTRDYGTISPCQSATIPVMPNDGVDLSARGEDILGSFEGMEGIGAVTLDVTRSTIDVAWCESSQSEETVRQALTAGGLVTVGASSSATASVTATATIDPAGQKQTLSVDTASETFSPDTIVLAAGMPAELTFGPAAGCITEVVIAQLGITQDLTHGGATVALPALEPGMYAFDCPMGHQGGQIIVR